jgi:hypothetical protein
VFESEEEREEYLEYLKTAEIKPNKKYECLVPDKLQNGGDGTQYRSQFTRAIAITELLDKFRREQEGYL